MEQLSEEQKAAVRVEIAKDVIAQVKAKRFRVRTGRYIVGDAAFDEQFGCGVNKPVRPPAQCQVCAIGGMFVAALDRFNELYMRDVSDSEPNEDNMRGYLSRWFEYDQLQAIEAAFEMWDVGNPAEGGFGRRYDLSADRLVAICENIITNAGSFAP